MNEFVFCYIFLHFSFLSVGVSLGHCSNKNVHRVQCIEGVSLRLQSMDTRPLQGSLPRVCDSLKGTASELFIGVAGVGGVLISNLLEARKACNLRNGRAHVIRDVY